MSLADPSFNRSFQNSPQRAGWWLRWVAYFIDGLIIGVIYLILFAIFGGFSQIASQAQYNALTNSYNVSNTGPTGAVIFADLFSFILSGLYFIYFWKRSGASLGQSLCHIRVVDSSTYGELTMSQCVIRYIGYIVSGFFFDLGFIWAAFDSNKQGWHDKMASTVVVKVN